MLLLARSHPLPPSFSSFAGVRLRDDAQERLYRGRREREKVKFSSGIIARAADLNYFYTSTDRLLANLYFQSSKGPLKRALVMTTCCRICRACIPFYPLYFPSVRIFFSSSSSSSFFPRRASFFFHSFARSFRERER